ILGETAMSIRYAACFTPLALALTCVLTGVPAVAQQGGGRGQQDQPGTRWTDDQLRQTVATARVGRKLTPKSWPGGARVAVCISFDDDTEAPLLRDGTTSPTTLSASDFGAE